MSRLAFFILSCALFASITFTFASPAPVVIEGLVNIEKRSEGRGTWYYPGLGNCGWQSSSSDFIIAIAKGLYDSNGGGYCGRGVTITCNGITEHATVVDSCQACSYNDIDMSPDLFQQFASLGVGVLTCFWNFN